MTLHSDDYRMFPSNFILSAFTGGYALFMANLEPILTIGLPVMFFVLGKAIDVIVKIKLAKRGKIDV